MHVCDSNLGLIHTEVDIPSDSPPYTTRGVHEKTGSTSWATQTIALDQAQQQADQEEYSVREAPSMQPIARGRQPVLPRPAM